MLAVSSSVPAPAAPYRTQQDGAFLTFYNYGDPLPLDPVRKLMLRALKTMTNEYGVDSGEKIGRVILYSIKSILGWGTLCFSVRPEANMTWGMFATATIGVTRFLERWDNVELAVDVNMGTDGEGKVGTAHLNRI